MINNDKKFNANGREEWSGLKKVICILILTVVALCGCGGGINVSSASSEAVNAVTADVVSRIKLSFENDSFLQQLMDMEWQHDSAQAVLGKRDAYFNRYDVYFDQGINVKYSEITTYYPESIGYYTEPVGNIETIILNQNYKGEIADGVTMKSSKKAIISRLGKPQFIDDSLYLFGYRAEDFYLFFIGSDRIEEISVYPVFAEANQAEALRQAQALCQESGYSRELAEKLAEHFAARFQNYNYHYALVFQDRYTSRAGKVGYASYTAGIEIQWDNRKQNGPILRIYGNTGSLPSIENTADIADRDGNVLIEYQLTDDLVFIKEQNRIHEKAEAAQRAAEEGVVSPDGNVILVDNQDWTSPLVTGFNVLYKDGSEPDFTILTSPFFGGAVWINDRYFLCNFSKSSLMIYDLQTKRSKLLSRSMYFIEVSPDKITVDQGTGEGDAIITYSFDKDGSIVLSCDHQSFYANSPWAETN